MQDFGKLLLRLMVGGLMLFHGYGKIEAGGEGLKQLQGMLGREGWPEFIAYGVYLGEIVAPLCLILGITTRMSAVVLGVNMVAAVWLAHRQEFWTLTPHHTWPLELHAFYFLGALAILCLGPGRMAVSQKF